MLLNFQLFFLQIKFLSLLRHFTFSTIKKKYRKDKNEGENAAADSFVLILCELLIPEPRNLGTKELRRNQECP